MDHSASATVPTSTMSPLYTFPSLLSFKPGPSATWLYTTLVILASLLVLEQTVYRLKKKHLPGSSWTIPIIGKFADSVSPTMEKYKRQWASGELSVVSVFNIFIVMGSSNQYARKILNSPTFAEPCLVYSAKTVLQSDNWVFLTGKEHVDYRRTLNMLFTRKALGMYVAVQDTVTRTHFAQWLKAAAEAKEPQPIMRTARHLNMETSLRVFCGRHIPESAAREISDQYWDITRALQLVNFPLALPGTNVYRAVKARKVAMYWLELAARESKAAIASGRLPECLLEEWIQVLADPAHKGRKDFSDREMAMTVFSFLFASQDAMSSGLIYAFQHLADLPDVMQKVKEEQERVRKGSYNSPITIDMLDQMPYLQAFVKESLRIKPPVLMVPYKTTKAFPINDEYTVPANSMVIPAFYDSLHDPTVYPEPDKLDPERWLDAEGSANSNPKNYMVWGAGPHRCIGIEYATMNIMLVLAIAISTFEFEHVVTPQSEEIEIIATIFPQDGCILKLTPKNEV